MQSQLSACADGGGLLSEVESRGRKRMRKQNSVVDNLQLQCRCPQGAIFFVYFFGGAQSFIRQTDKQK